MEEEKDVQEVETTTESSSDETQTTEESASQEESSADTSDQTEESGQPRSSQRIQELVKERNEAKERADYWEKLNQQANADFMPEGDVITADDIQKIVSTAIQQDRVEVGRKEAAMSLKRDIEEASKKYPQLMTDDRLSKKVLAVAQALQISVSEATEEILGSERLKKDNASKANKVGVSAPKGKRVATGEQIPPDISNMTEKEKEANWGEIVQSLG